MSKVITSISIVWFTQNKILTKVTTFMYGVPFPNDANFLLYRFYCSSQIVNIKPNVAKNHAIFG